MITIGSLFSGIGCFELGLLRGIPNSQVIWQCEKDTFCQSILKKHWPNTRLYTDITKMDTQDVVRPDIMCAGFPCQDLSISGLQRGIYEGKKSSLYWYAFALFSRLRPDIIVLENVSNLLRLGGREVLGSLAEIGYDAEWTTLSARQFGAPHRRDRVFIVAYSGRIRRMEHTRQQEAMEQPRLQGTQRKEGEKSDMSAPTHRSYAHATNPDNERRQEHVLREPIEKMRQFTQGDSQNPFETYSQRVPNPPAICRVDDGIRNRVHRIKALGNATNPQSKRREIQPVHPERMEERLFSQRRNSKNERIHTKNYWQRVKSPPSICRVDDGIRNRTHRIKALGNAIVPQCTEYIGHRIYEGIIKPYLL